jgi:hypothetical protein
MHIENTFRRIPWSVALIAASAVALRAVAQASPVPPGVPEPGLVIWGAVVNQTNVAQAVTITSASWSVTDGTKTAVYSEVSRPPTRIVGINGQSYYVAQVAFDTRVIGAITLADPISVGIDSFELKSTLPPTYTLTPTINGVLATVRSIDGAPAAGGNFPVSGFTSSTRGRIIRVDLGIIPVADDYDAWAAANFGSSTDPNAARTADPDGDGLNNEGEHAAGTDPNDPDSVLQVLVLEVQSPTQAVIGWQSAPSRSYIIEFAPSPEGPWGALGGAVASAGDVTQAALNLPLGENLRFYRVRIAP